MARGPTSEKSKSGKVTRSGFEKMQMNHLQTRKRIQHIHAEAARRTSTGKPVHVGHLPRR